MVMDYYGYATFLNFGTRESERNRTMVFTDDTSNFQDVYCGGPLSTDYNKTFRNNMALSPLKSFCKIKRTVQLIGNRRLSAAYKQLENSERSTMAEYELYERKQERTLERISKKSSNRRLRRLERIMNVMESGDTESTRGDSARLLRRPKKRRVVAKKRVGGTYLKRLKLATDSLQNTDPEKSMNSGLNMESYLAYKDFNQNKRGVGKRRKKNSCKKEFSRTERKAINNKAKETLDKLIPMWRGRAQAVKKLTDEEIEVKKNQLFHSVQGLHTTLPISEVLSRSRRRRGFRAGAPLRSESRDSLHTRSHANGKESPHDLFTSSTRLPLPEVFRSAVPAQVNRRQLAETDNIYRLTSKIKTRELRIDEEIGLIESYVDLTQSGYLRDDEGRVQLKREEYRQMLEKLNRRKNGLQRSWINVVTMKKRALLQSPPKPPKNKPMIPLINNLAKRIRNLSLNGIVQSPPHKTRAPNMFRDLLKKIEEREEFEQAPVTPGAGLTTRNGKQSTLQVSRLDSRDSRRSTTSVEEMQKALNLPTKTATERREERERREQKEMREVKRKEARIALPPILSVAKPGVSATSLNSLSTPNLVGGKEPITRKTKRRSSISDKTDQALSKEDMGFKMNIFLSGLSASSTEGLPTIEG